LAASALIALALAGAAAAQEQLQVSQPEPGTIRLGDTARVTIRVEGKAANPRSPELPVVEGLRTRLLGPSRSSYTFYDGRRLVERVGVQYVVELQPTVAGVFEVPPFSIWTGSKEQRTPKLRLEAKADLVGAELGFLEVSVAPRRVYVHEPIRVSFVYGVQQGVKLADAVADRYRYQDIEVQAAWLEDFPGGEPLEVAEPAGETRVAVCNRKLIRAGFDGERDRGGKQWQQYSFDRAFLPTRLGQITLSAPMLRFRAVSGRSRTDRFGRRAGQASENYYVYGDPVELEVLPIPEAGRPTPYFGAVGRFSVEASLDRSQVRVGESVKLTLTVRGRGNFEFLRLPELIELEGFHKLGSNEAQRDADKVAVTYDLTPLSADVAQVPEIRWNYFDTTPGVEEFVEVTTPALALDVQPLVSGEVLAALPEEAAAAVTPGVDDIFDLPDLDGAPVRRVTVAAWAVSLFALTPWLLVIGLSRWRRARQRALADVAGQRTRRARRVFEQALAGDGDAFAALTAYLADRLDVAAAAVISPELTAMLVERGLDSTLAADVAATVERGVNARYGGGGEFSAAAARALVAKLEGYSFGLRPAGRSPASALLVFALACGGADLRAQGDDALRLYRQGDYAGADAAFKLAYERTLDRRLLRARGNCQFRLGQDQRRGGDGVSAANQYARARLYYERARLGLPRDDELLANLAVVARKLELPSEARGFSAELRRQIERVSARERAWLCSAAMLLAAACLVCGWRRIGLRWVGLACLALGLTLVIDVVVLQSGRPAMAVALEELQVTAEPRVDMSAVATVRPGVMVALGGGSSGAFVRVEVAGRVGYVPRASVGIVD